MLEQAQAVIALVKHFRQTCPWTRSQTFKSLAPQTLEEAYELVDAIEQNNIEELKSELGDVFYHTVLYCAMAEEQGWFSFEDIAADTLAKHEQRMPPEELRANLDPEGVNTYWNHQKMKQLSEQESVLSGVAKTIPALMRAIKLQNRAAKVGFDWPHISMVVDKLHEELCELQEAYHTQESPSRIEEEYGDLLFVIANLGRHLQVDPELALRRANEKFTERFHYIEKQARRRNKALTDLSLEEMDAYWEEAKT